MPFGTATSFLTGAARHRTNHTAHLGNHKYCLFILSIFIINCFCFSFQFKTTIGASQGTMDGIPPARSKASSAPMSSVTAAFKSRAFLAFLALDIFSTALSWMSFNFNKFAFKEVYIIHMVYSGEFYCNIIIIL